MADIRVTSEIDNFSRADENPLSAGGNYAQVRTSGDFSQQLQNKSNDAWPQTGAAHFSASYWTPESFTGDMEMWGEVTGFTDNQNAWYLCFIKDVGTANIDGYICGWIDAVGDRMEVILDGGVRRGTHVLKALSLGATAVSGGRLYLYALAAAGEAGVERALAILEAEIVRDMKLMGVTRVDQLNRENLRFR